VVKLLNLAARALAPQPREQVLNQFFGYRVALELAVGHGKKPIVVVLMNFLECGLVIDPERGKQRTV